MDDQKYVVFKRDDLFKMLGQFLPKHGDCAPVAQRMINEVERVRLDDAVVIRTKDLLSGTALRAYADTASNAIEIMMELGQEVPASLERIRDYFYAKSDDAYGTPVKRLPD